MDKNSKVKRIATKVLSVFCTVILILAIGIFALSFFTKSENGIKFIGKHAIVKVITDSMFPTLEVGDCLLIEKSDGNDLEVGDIITFISSDPTIRGALNTHAVYAIDGDVITTKGDKYDTPDVYKVQKTDVVGKYVRKLPVTGFFLRLLSSPQGFMLMIFVPMMLVIGLTFKDFTASLQVKKKTENSEEDAAEAEKKLLEETIEKMKQSGELQERLDEINKKK